MPGFTFIETMVTLIIITILTLIAIPSFQSLSTNTNSQVLKSQVLSAIQLAQEEARARHTPIVICLIDNASQCVKANSKQLAIFIDEKLDGMIHHQQQILIVKQIKTNMLYARYYPINQKYLRFFNDAAGMHNFNGTFWHCTQNKELQWAIMLSGTGHARIILPKQGKIIDNQGNALTC